jgi:filamentous hemagglutinin
MSEMSASAAGRYVPDPMLEHLGRGYGLAAEQAFRSWLRLGKQVEAAELKALGLDPETVTWRPEPWRIETATFKAIVGPAEYTPSGRLRGTILDATDGGFLEIKYGRSVLSSTYQMRLQTYRSLIEDTPYAIRTSRPLNPRFKAYLDFWGVSVEPLR